MTRSWAAEWSRSMADCARSGSAIWASSPPGSARSSAPSPHRTTCSMPISPTRTPPPRFATTDGNQGVYPVVFIDAIHVKIRDSQVANRPIYAAIGVTVDGERDILGLWVGTGGEGAKYCKSSPRSRTAVSKTC